MKNEIYYKMNFNDEKIIIFFWGQNWDVGVG